MITSRLQSRSPLFVVALGLALFVVAVVHHANELLVLERGIGPIAAILLDGPLALGLAYTGVRLRETEFAPDEQWSVCRWCVAGLLLFVAVMGATFLIRVLEGRSVAEPIFPLLIAADVGGLAGVVAGYYNVRARKDARHAEAVREELTVTNQQLQASNERLEQFAYAASHDLKEPLRMVVSYLGLLEDRYGDELEDDAEEFVAFAVDGAERMEEMIESLLAYSRVETTGDQFEPVDLEAVLDDVLADLQLQIEASDAEVTADDLPVVEGDGGQLRQLFQNLLDNAIEYSGDEPPRIHVAAARDGEDWRLTVEDEGIGIDPEHTDRVFEVFQRLHTAEEHAGTGIGLAMCERIVERHGGEIWVESTPGEGTTFSFTVPVPADERARHGTDT